MVRVVIGGWDGAGTSDGDTRRMGTSETPQLGEGGVAIKSLKIIAHLDWKYSIEPGALHSGLG